MGCLKKFINAIIITLAIVGFFSLGGKDLVSKWVDNWFNPPKDVMIERAKKVGDFSHINSEFEIEKAKNRLEYDLLYFEDATGLEEKQKIEEAENNQELKNKKY